MNRGSFFSILLIVICSMAVLISSCKKDETDKNDDAPNTVEEGVEFETADGYKAVKIGTQIWMAENLNIPSGTYAPVNTAWRNLTGSDAAYCYFNNDPTLRDKYGLLNTYEAALNACPSGWHLPNDAEWITLINYLDRTYGYSVRCAKD